MSFSHFCIQKSSLFGKVKLSPSKSHTLRACLFAALADGVSHIFEYLPSPDTEAMIQACKVLGAQVEEGAVLAITGRGTNRSLTSSFIDAGNSGQVLRFVTACAALSDLPLYITGDASIQTKRVAKPLVDGLLQLGARATTYKNSGFAPLCVCGPINSGSVIIDGKDSQPVSALLIAAAQLPGTTTIQVENIGERPWIDVTLDWLRRMGVRVVVEAYDRFCVFGGVSFKGFDYCVPGDLSTLSFLLVAALMRPSDLVIENADLDDVQPDSRVVAILEQMGAQFQINKEQKTIGVKGPQRLSGIAVDVNDCIDALPILAVCGSYAEGKTRLFNGKIARNKESDRIFAMCKELSKMGASIFECDDGLTIHKSSLVSAMIDSHNDHRIALSLAIAAMNAEGSTTIYGSQCVSKSYPGFMQDMLQLGVSIA